MKRPLALVLLVAIAVAVYAGRHRSEEFATTGAVATSGSGPVSERRAEEPADDGSLARAIAGRAEDVPVTGHGTVVKLLPDDREGNPHQRFILRVAGGGTVLIAHNLELGARVEPLAIGDEVEFAGDYVWNDKGGVVHWTHADPQGRHRDGWLHRLAR